MNSIYKNMSKTEIEIIEGGTDKKKLMIMGAGIYQVPLIKKAKAMGLETLVVSIPGEYPGIALADEFIPLDTRDKEGILKYAMERGIRGICTSGTDVAVQTIGYVNEHMNLSGISYEAAQKVTDKLLMKQAFSKHDVSTAAFEKVTSYEQALSAADTIGYPVIVKIVDSSGSRGVKKVKSREELLDAYTEASNITKKDYLLIEAFIDAEEIGVDAFVSEHGIEVFLPHEKFTYTVNGVTVPMGHAFPFHADNKLFAELEKQMNLAVEAVGLKNCPVNADVFIKEDKVWIIEIGGRTGATCIPELISTYKGYDWYEKIIRAALGESVDFTSEKEIPCMAKLLFSHKDGIIKHIDQKVVQTLLEKGVIVQLDYGIGKTIETMKNATDRIGHVIMSGDDESVLDEYLAMLRGAIELEENSSKLEM